MSDLKNALISYGYTSQHNSNLSNDNENKAGIYPYIISGKYTDENKGHIWIVGGGRSTTETHYFKYYTMTERKRMTDFERSEIEIFHTNYSYFVWGWLSTYDGWYMRLYDPNTGKSFENIQTIMIKPTK